MEAPLSERVIKPLLSGDTRPATIAEEILTLSPYREVIPRQPNESFRFLNHDYPSEIARWQYHPEFEIHLIREGTGSFIIGDTVGAFTAGQVYLMGSGLPHDWMSDLEPGQVIRNRDAVIQFEREWLAKCSETIPEIADTRHLLQESSRGILFKGETAEKAAIEIEAVGVTEGIARIAHLMNILSLMANAPAEEKELIANEWYTEPSSRDEATAADAGIAYIFENLRSHIRMSEAARLASMSEPTFSKYFRKVSGLTFSDMVKKLRIAHACRLLEQTDKAVSAIAEDSGYTNLANFNKQFLSEVGMTPREYRNLDEADRPGAKVLSLGTKAPTSF